jgi:hypothetical protein
MRMYHYLSLVEDRRNFGDLLWAQTDGPYNFARETGEGEHRQTNIFARERRGGCRPHKKLKLMHGRPPPPPAAV